MRSILTFAAAAAGLAIALPAAAQTASPSTSTPGASDLPPAISQGGAASASGSSGAAAAPGVSEAAVTNGLPVKDNTGATIGQVTEVKPGAGGKQTATIKMGADSFAVDTASLAVQNGAAVINATQAELQGMISKARPAATATTTAPAAKSAPATTPKKKH